MADEPDFPSRLVDELLAHLHEYPDLARVLAGYPQVVQRELRLALIAIVEYELDISGRR